MNKVRILFFGFLVLFLVMLYLLLTGSKWLTYSLNEANDLPLGTFITWAGMISFPLCIYWGVKPLRQPVHNFHKWLSWILKVVIVLALLWVPVSYGLSGTMSFNFSEKETFQGGQLAMQWFWRFSYGIPLGSLLVFLGYALSLLFVKRNS